MKINLSVLADLCDFCATAHSIRFDTLSSKIYAILGVIYALCRPYPGSRHPTPITGVSVALLLSPLPNLLRPSGTAVALGLKVYQKIKEVA